MAAMNNPIGVNNLGAGVVTTILNGEKVAMSAELAAKMEESRKKLDSQEGAHSQQAVQLDQTKPEPKKREWVRSAETAAALKAILMGRPKVDIPSPMILRDYDDTEPYGNIPFIIGDVPHNIDAENEAILRAELEKKGS